MHMKQLQHGRRVSVALSASLSGRVSRLRSLAGVGDAKPSESALISTLVARGLAAVESEHNLPPIEEQRSAA